jgi:hypothetical protein
VRRQSIAAAKTGYEIQPLQRQFAGGASLLRLLCRIQSGVAMILATSSACLLTPVLANMDFR